MPITYHGKEITNPIKYNIFELANWSSSYKLLQTQIQRRRVAETSKQMVHMMSSILAANPAFLFYPMHEMFKVVDLLMITTVRITVQ